MTLHAQIIEKLAAKGVSFDTEIDRVRLDFAANQYPLNGFVVVNGRQAYDFVCSSGGSVWVGAIE